jgi:predicted transcriptional regulator
MSSQTLLADESRSAAAEARALLISIQPRFAAAILDGAKTIELRRTVPTLGPGALALIYSSTPVKALVGWACVAEIIEQAPSTLWRSHSTQTGVTAAEFRDYFAGSRTAYGLRLAGVQTANQLVSLGEMRQLELEPPQSWRYVTSDLAATLKAQMGGQQNVEAHGIGRLHGQPAFELVKRLLHRS